MAMTQYERNILSGTCKKKYNKYLRSSENEGHRQYIFLNPSLVQTSEHIFAHIVICNVKL